MIHTLVTVVIKGRYTRKGFMTIAQRTISASQSSRRRGGGGDLGNCKRVVIDILYDCKTTRCGDGWMVEWSKGKTVDGRDGRSYAIYTLYCPKLKPPGGGAAPSGLN